MLSCYSGRQNFNYKNKTGRHDSSGLTFGVPLDSETRKNFDIGVEYYKSGRARTKQDAYDYMCHLCYSYTTTENNVIVHKLKPESEIPTLRQFYYYCKTHITSQEEKVAKTSYQDYRNDSRLLIGDDTKNVYGFGDLVEIDECEVDLSIVSTEDSQNTIGRPVLYLMIDVFTRIILAFSVAFDNNSYIGVTNCLANLAADKAAFCKQYGIEISPDAWPSNIYPSRLRSDRGSEYTSKEFHRVCNEMRITHELVTAGTGSLKGIVERQFREFQSTIGVHTENFGQITKRHDSRHHQEATLNIDDFTKMVIVYVLTHNRKYLNSYPLTSDMQKAGVLPIPIELVKYSKKIYGEPRPINDINQFTFCLLQPVKATIGRTGICFEGLTYIDLSDNYLVSLCKDAGSKKKEFNARIDPRCVEKIYYVIDNKLISVPLSNRTSMEGIAKLSLSEYRERKKQKRKQDKEYSYYNTALNVSSHEAYEDIVRGARHKVTGSQNTRDITLNRQKEQHKLNQNNSVVHVVTSDDATATNPPELSDSNNTSPDTFEDEFYKLLQPKGHYE